MSPATRLCFVCLGNICRSPTAAAVMAHLVREAGVSDRIHIESAGTGGWHVGDGPDPRAAAEARRRGVPMPHRAQKFTTADFVRFDLILAMDRENVADLMAIAPAPEHAAKISLLRSFDPAAPPDAFVSDPYYGGADGFREVFDQVERACRGLLAGISSSHVPNVGSEAGRGRCQGSA